MDGAVLSRIDSAIRKDYRNINGIVVSRNGYLVYERYYNDACRRTKTHMTSVTKSFISALIGIAIDKKYVSGVDCPVGVLFPEYFAAKSIRIGDLLTMTVPYDYESWREPLDKLCMQADWMKYISTIIGRNGKMGEFKYSSAGAHVLSAVISRATKQSAREFANDNLFSRIGIDAIPDFEMRSFGYEDLFGEKVRGWVKDPQGITTGGWGLTLTTQEMARFGLLYVNDGLWNNERVVSEEWISDSTRPHSQIDFDGVNMKYGYLWWLYDADDVHVFAAVGDGGNAIFCIPGRKVVVAISSGFTFDAKDRWELIRNYILPAIGD